MSNVNTAGAMILIESQSLRMTTTGAVISIESQCSWPQPELRSLLRAKSSK